jgi:hypothetical protein
LSQRGTDVQILLSGRIEIASSNIKSNSETTTGLDGTYTITLPASFTSRQAFVAIHHELKHVRQIEYLVRNPEGNDLLAQFGEKMAPKLRMAEAIVLDAINGRKVSDSSRAELTEIALERLGFPSLRSRLEELTRKQVQKELFMSADELGFDAGVMTDSGALPETKVSTYGVASDSFLRLEAEDARRAGESGPQRKSVSLVSFLGKVQPVSDDQFQILTNSEFDRRAVRSALLGGP